MIRRSYGCDCNGDAVPGRCHPAATEGLLSTIDRITSGRPPSCPWSAFEDPLVQDVTRAYRFFESGQLDVYLGGDPPAKIVEGIAHYHAAIQRVQMDDLEKRRKKLEGGG